MTIAAGTATVRDSPFHAGERRVQERLGVRERSERMGRRLIRDQLTEDEQDFYGRLPTLIVGSVDGRGRPWASMLAGRPGFVHAPNPRTLAVRGGVVAGDPFAAARVPGASAGVLGIELHSRRRHRLSGRIREVGDGETALDVTQAFGNCPKYIQAREYALLDGIDRVGEPRPLVELTALEEHARQIVAGADGFFIATCHPRAGTGPAAGVDVSHRGGRPGFVRIDGVDRLTWPEFGGNNFFNTLGNIELNPLAGLLVPDFGDGSLLYITGRAEVLWDDPELARFRGAERLVRLQVEQGRIIERAIPIQWRFLGYSRSLDGVGHW